MNLNNIPQELKNLKQWVNASQFSKIPMQSDVTLTASSSDPSTWCDFDTAKASVDNGRYEYVGFVFNDNGIVGIDIDTGYDEDGFISPLACDIISRCNSYTEKSKSGRGFHILVKGDLPFKGKNNLNGVEIYKQARFFIMTGDVISNSQIIENQDAIDYIVKTYFPETRESSNTYSNRIYTPIWEKPNNNRFKLRPTYPQIPDGTRNVSLTSLAGQLHTIGYDSDSIYDELIYVNQVACNPPLDEYEIRQIVNSITRYRR